MPTGEGVGPERGAHPHVFFALWGVSGLPHVICVLFGVSGWRWDVLFVVWACFGGLWDVLYGVSRTDGVLGAFPCTETYGLARRCTDVYGGWYENRDQVF